MKIDFSIQFNSIDNFIEHWSGRYDYPHESRYEVNVGRPLTEQSRRELYEWKNGSPISARKWKSVVANYPLVFVGDCEERYLNPKKPGGAIWNIFYLHCLDPNRWPIFDQHTYRAMVYMKSGEFAEIGTTNRKKYQQYKEEYMPFLRAIGKFQPRSLDKALFSFGQFLKFASKYAYIGDRYGE